MSQTTRAVLLCIAAVFMFNLETVFIKWVEGVPLATMVLARSLGQLVWILPELLRDPGLPRTRHLRMALFRGLLSAMSWYTYYLSYAGLPLATATVLSFTTVLFVTALAGPVLGERVGWRRWAAAAVGFAGVLVIVRPGVVEVDWPVAGAIFSALMGAAIVLTTKTLARSERTGTIMFWIGAVSVAISTPVALPGLEWMGWRNLGLLVAAGVAGPFAMQLWINALRMADASFLAPIAYTRLVFAAGFGIALFGEVPDLWLGVGTALILGSALYITRREARLAREAQRGTPAAATAASSDDASKPKSR